MMGTLSASLKSFHITNVAFEAALDASQRDSERVGLSARRLLIDWTFKAGRYTTGWGTFETGLTALVALVLRLDKPQLIAWLKQEVTRRLQFPLIPICWFERRIICAKRLPHSVRETSLWIPWIELWVNWIGTDFVCC